MSERKRGSVKWFDSAKGYGFIIGPEGGDVFVHYRVIVGEGYRSLDEGEQVEYLAVHGEKGWQATEVVSVATTAPVSAGPMSAESMSAER